MGIFPCQPNQKIRKIGFCCCKAKGPHIRLEKNMSEGTIKITVPNHKTLKKGTLHHILKSAGLNLNDLL